MICLSWIQSLEKEFKLFVQNRVLEIRRNIDSNIWYYCPSESNPADIITCLDSHNLSSSMWLQGPRFLYDNEFVSTPLVSTDELKESDDYCNEVKGDEVVEILVTTNIEDEPSLGNVIKIENFSNLLKLFRVTAYVLRFINKLRKRLCYENKFQLLYCRRNEERTDNVGQGESKVCETKLPTYSKKN